MADLPALSGFRFRRLDAPKDYAAMADLINAFDQADGIEDHTSTEDVAANYRHPENSDPAVDMVMAERDGALVGYTRAQWTQEVDGPRIHWVVAFVHPSVRHTGLMETLLDWSEERNREVAAADGAVDTAYQTFVEEHRQQWLAAIFEARGYRVETYGASMVRPDLDHIPRVDLPEGLEIRRVEKGHLRAIWEADNEAFRDHWGFSEPSEAQYQRFLEFPHRDESLWKIAWQGDRIVGQVRSFINEAENEQFRRRRGYTEFISTERSWRKRGVATALICESLRELADRGMDEAALGVHTENPTGAFDLYKSLGFALVESWLTFRRPFVATER